MDSTKEKSPSKATGKRYASVEGLMKGENISSNVQKRVSRLKTESQVSRKLAEMRTAAGMTQAQLARKIGTTQSCISKWESESDRELTLNTIGAYCSIFDQRVAVFFGKPMKHVEKVKMHAVELKQSLRALAALAENGDDQEIEKGVKAFFGEAFFNLLDILELCQKQLPEKENGDSGRDGIEIRMEIHPQETLRRLPATEPVAAK